MFQVDGLVGRLAQLLTDEDFDFWSRGFHVASIAEAVALVVQLRPEASAARAELALVAGFAQQLPEDAASLISVDSVDGRGLTRFSSKVLEGIDPCWRKAAQVQGIEGFMDESDVPNEFWVYPAARGGEKASVVYARELAVEAGGSVDMGVKWVKHITNYCLYRAYQREGTQTQKEQFYRNAFYDGLGIAQQAAQVAEAEAATT